MSKMNKQSNEHIVIEIADGNEDPIKTHFEDEIVPHNGKPITKMVISPKLEYVVTYSQEDESFFGWRVGNEGPLILDKVQPYNHKSLSLDFKVSDNKILMYEGNTILTCEGNKRIGKVLSVFDLFLDLFVTFSFIVKTFFFVYSKDL